MTSRSLAIALAGFLAFIAGEGVAIESAGATDLRHELRYTHDLKAVFDRYRNLPDPSGEIAFILAGVAGDCGDFAGRSVDSLVKQYADAAGPGRRPDEAKRAATLKLWIGRCDGFESNRSEPRVRSNDTQLLYTEMHQKALDAGYPGEIARRVSLTSWSGKVSALADEMAIRLMSGNVSRDVIVELGPYIVNRNIPVDRRVGATQERGVWATAWQLLGCEFGADCNPGSRAYYMMCLVYGACDLESIDEVLLARGTNDDHLAAAHALSARLAAAIRTRNWQALGF